MNHRRSISAQGFRIRTSNERFIMSKKSKVPKLPELKCLLKTPHPQHEWMFHYNDTPIDRICPGLKDEDDG